VRVAQRQLDGHASFRSADVDDRVIAVPGELLGNREGGAYAEDGHGVHELPEALLVLVHGEEVLAGLGVVVGRPVRSAWVSWPHEGYRTALSAGLVPGFFRRVARVRVAIAFATRWPVPRGQSVSPRACEAALLNACTVDVAVIGRQAVAAYRTVPEPARWGIILAN
jgi:hypothetical protein